MSDERTNFEQRLADLRPASSIDRGCVMFAAGQASVTADRESGERFWKRIAMSTSATSLLLVVALAVSATSNTSNGLDHSQRLAEGMSDAPADGVASGTSNIPLSLESDTTPSADGARNRLPAPSSSQASSTHLASDNTQVNPSSQFALRRIALAERQQAVPERSRKSSDVNPFRLGDTRRVLAMAGTKEASFRRLDALHPRRPSSAMDVLD